MKKLGRKRQRAAAKAPRWVRDIAAAHFDPKGVAEHRQRQLGTFGPASDVRRIDPKDYPHSSPSSPRATDMPAGVTSSPPAGKNSVQP